MDGIMTVLVLDDGSTYILSAALPPPHHSNCDYAGDAYLSSMKAINLYPDLAGQIMLTANRAAREASDEKSSCAFASGRRVYGEEGP